MNFVYRPVQGFLVVLLLVKTDAEPADAASIERSTCAHEGKTRGDRYATNPPLAQSSLGESSVTYETLGL
jgi:hypothetical protein